MWSRVCAFEAILCEDGMERRWKVENGDETKENNNWYAAIDKKEKGIKHAYIYIANY